MPTRTEIIEAGARAIHESQCCPLDANSGYDLSDAPVSLVETALSAMLPLIKAQLAAEVRGGCVREVVAVHESHGEEAWCPEHKEHWPCANEASAQLIEEYEPAP